jgi:PAS domain S-box-containing protein
MYKGGEHSRSTLDKAGELEKILDNTPFLLTRCSRDLRYLYVSKAYATMIGRASDEIVGKPIIEIMGPSGFETIRRHVEAALRGQRVEFESEIQFAGIGPRQVRVIYVPERDDQIQVVGWIASIIDIGEPSEATEEKEQLKKLTAEMGIGIWDWDMRTDTLSWTPELEVIYGIHPATGKSCTDFHNRVHHDDVKDVEARLAAAIGARETFQLEFRIVRPDGQMRWVMALGRAVYDKVTGEPVRVIGTNIDITQRKANEAQAEIQRNELTHLMRVASLGGLSGGIAHEISQPLASILANAQSAQTMLAREGADSAQLAEILDDIVQDNIRASQVIHRLRRLFKKTERSEAPINLNDLIASTLALLHHEMVNRKIKVSAEFSATLPLVSGEAVELQQVLINLIMNAIEAMTSTPPSERTVSIVTKETKQGHVEVSIRDRGPGMSPDELSRIFEPHFTTKEKGLGFGLSICSTIVALHRGQIDLRNASEGGMVATVSLPKTSQLRTVNQ